MTTRHTLDNGLTVILKEVHTAPLISWWVLYRVGSRNEPTGLTGASHWVEHMLFKGTEKYPPGYLDHAIDRLGGLWNAQTAHDYTAYYETLPADAIDLALDLEADRMLNAAFDPREVEAERTVIISERQGLENSPFFWLSEEVHAAAFRVHGYHHEIIGDLADLHTMTRDDLYAHYRRHYTPANAIITAVGAFDTDDLLRRIDAHYGRLPGGERPDLFVRPEPAQGGERRVVVTRPGDAAALMVAYHVPGAAHDDWYRLTVLDSILTGADGFGGGGIDNRTSRLYQTLVETDIAAGVEGGLSTSIDPYLYSIIVTLRDGRTPHEAEDALDAEINRLHAGHITDHELARAKKQARALFAYATESVTNQANWLAFAENFADYTWFERYMTRIEAVTLADVLDVAQAYLVPQRRTVGWLLPGGDIDGDEGEPDDDDA